MKLTGSKRRGRHVNDGSGAAAAGNMGYYNGGAHTASPARQNGKKRRKKRGLKVLIVILVILVIGAAAAIIYVRNALNTKPPVREAPKGANYTSPGGSRSIPGPSPNKPGVSDETRFGKSSRNESKFTFLILAMDDGNGNTDTIMSGTFDVTNNTFDIVSIPRDTLVNVSWSLKKANSIYANMRQANGWEDDALNDGMDDVVTKFSDVLGYKVDYWFLVDMKAFVTLVDAIDGVDFEIPVNMNYDDNSAGLSIHYSAGMNHLSGSEALEVMRYRSGYASADIGRIGTQQGFLSAAAEQILARSSSISVVDLANVFINYVKTNIKLDYLIWFANAFLKLDADDVNFHLMPGNYNDPGGEYVTIYVEEWLEMLNDKFNPFGSDIELEDVSILTRGSDGAMYVTDGDVQGVSWSSGGGGGGSSQGGSSQGDSSSAYTTPDYSEGYTDGGGEAQAPVIIEPSYSPPADDEPAPVDLSGDQPTEAAPSETGTAPTDDTGETPPASENPGGLDEQLTPSAPVESSEPTPVTDTTPTAPPASEPPPSASDETMLPPSTSPPPPVNETVQPEAPVDSEAPPPTDNG